MFKTFAASLLAAGVSATCDVTFESNGQFKIKHPAFLDVMAYDDAPDDKFLLISQFGAFATGTLSVVTGIKEAVEARDVSGLSGVKLDTANFEWPNDIKVVPYDVFNQRAIVVPDGFLVPGKENGGVYIVTMDDTDPTVATNTYHISTEENGFFYHMGYWIDLSGDGKKDFLTARSNAKAGDGQMVWFEQPAEGLEGGTWTEHVICTGCADVGITMIEDDQFPGEYVIFAAQFFDETVSFVRIDKKTGEYIDRRVIDDMLILSAYMVTYQDINGDGVPELLVNNHETDDDLNGIYAYGFPTNDWMNGDFTRTTLASEFHNAFSVFVPTMSPGFTYPFYPSTNPSKGEAAHLIVAGDGDYTAHIMTPTDKDFHYDVDTMKVMKGTVGALCYADLDGDGWNEVWVPDYDNGLIELFNFAPNGSNSQTDLIE